MEIIVLRHVQEYVDALSSQTEKHQINKYFLRQEMLGRYLKRPVSALLGEGICEIRPGPYRFLFFFDKHAIVVCHVFRKKTKRAPRSEIERAVSNRTKYLNGEMD